MSIPMFVYVATKGTIQVHFGMENPFLLLLLSLDRLEFHLVLFCMGNRFKLRTLHLGRHCVWVPHFVVAFNSDATQFLIADTV